MLETLQPIIGALVFGVSLLIVCIFAAASIVLVRAAVYVEIITKRQIETAGEDNDN